LLELRPENTWKTYSTRRGYEGYLRRWIVPRWGAHTGSRHLQQNSKCHERAVQSCTPTRTVRRNPIEWVRQSAKRRNAPEVLTAHEIQSLLPALELRERTLVLLDIGTGLRMSELFALHWKDVDLEQLQVHVRRSIVYQVVGACKTEASQKPVPLHRSLAKALGDWRSETPYSNDEDWLFASPHTCGRQPYWGEALMRQHIQPALRRIGISKRVGWHTFRHTYSTLLKAAGADVKVMQELLRHASVRVTLDTYTQAVTAAKREAQASVLNLLGLARDSQEPAPHGWSKRLADCLTDIAKWLHLDLFRPRFLRAMRA
jgi:integrase